MPHLCFGKCSVNIMSTFREVRPVLKVNRDDHGLRERARGLYCVRSRHRKMTWPEFEYAGSAQMQNGDFNVEPMCNFGNAGVPNRITLNINDVLGCVVEK